MQNLEELVEPIRDDLTSGAAEIALRAISVFQTSLADAEQLTVPEAKQLLINTARALIDAQPAMAPLFYLGNSVLLAVDKCQSSTELISACRLALSDFEKKLCDNAAVIANLSFDLIPSGDLAFAYSFSSTVVTALMNARARGRFFRVACTESRPMMEGRKLAAALAAGKIEVITTFDSAMGLILSSCRAAFMGCDCIGRPGLVNKVGSWMLAMACKEKGIPLYVLTGTEKFVTDERVFEFEKHERPGHEVWLEAPAGVRIMNHQFELIPIDSIAGIVTEQGILQEKDIERYVSNLAVHESLRLQSSTWR